MFPKLSLHFLSCFLFVVLTTHGQVKDCKDSSGRFYITNDTMVYYATTPLATPNALFVPGGFNFNHSPYDGASFLMKLDYNGNKIWHKIYNNIYSDYTHVTELQDKSLLLYGRDNSLAKADANGNISWTKLYSPALAVPGFEINEIKQDPSSGNLYMTVGFSSGFCIAKIDASNGAVSWSKSYAMDNGYLCVPIGIDIQTNRIRLFSISRKNDISFYASTCVNMLDIDKSSGDTIQSKAYNTADINGDGVNFYFPEPLTILTNGHYALSGICASNHFAAWDGKSPLVQAAVAEFDGNLNFVKAYAFQNSIDPQGELGKFRISVYPDNTGMFIMQNDLSGYTSDNYYIEFKNGQILKQRRERYSGMGINDVATAPVQTPVGGSAMVQLWGDSAQDAQHRDAYHLQLLKIKLTDTLSCLGENDNTTTIYNFNYVPCQFNYGSILSNVLTVKDDIPVVGTEIPLGKSAICVEAALPTVTLNLGNDTTVCSGNTVKLNAHAGFSSYQWQNGSMDSIYTVKSGGKYSVSVTDACENKFSDTVAVLYKLLPAVHLGNDTTVCNGITKILDATNNNSTYLWQDGSNTAIYTVAKEGLYYVTVDMNGCKTVDSITISYTQKPVLYFLDDDMVICKGQRIIIDPVTNTTVRYLWQDGSTEPSLTIIDTGVYKLTVSNACGSASSSIAVRDGVCELNMPSAFTPHNDGLNDLFRVKYPFSVRSFSFVIYNRWGTKIFESSDMSKGWDGTYNGTDQNTGVYIWMISFIDDAGIKKSTKGSVLLIR